MQAHPAPVRTLATHYIPKYVTVRPTPADLESLFETLKRDGELSPDDLSAALPHLRVRLFARGEHLLRAGDVAELAGIVLQGYMREYFMLEGGTERTKAFIFSGDPTGSAPDLISGEPSTTNIVAEAKSRVLLINFRELRRLCDENPTWDRVTRALLDRILIRKSRREFELLTLDAAGRYARLLADRPNIEQLVQARHLASYLGITPVHLSRLRRRRWVAKQSKKPIS